MTDLHWHQALAFALTGRRLETLGSQSRPELPVLVEALAAELPGGISGLRAAVRDRRSSGEPWPYPVPDDLGRGLGAAQWLAALSSVRQQLDLDSPERPVLSDRAPDADELRLLRDVPPHHG